jgi:hypothetical protein
MADLKISELALATSVSGTDVIPIVNTGTTKKVTLTTLFDSSSSSYAPYINQLVQPVSTLVQTNSAAWNYAYVQVANNGSEWTDHVLSNENVSVGPQNLERVTTGYKNTSVGVKALSANTVGSGNVAVGYQSLFSTTSGSGNTAVGYNAGYANVVGVNNTYIGNQATGNCPDESNVITLGNSAIKTLRCQAATITSISDARDKKDIVPLEIGLDFINSLHPVEFTWNMRDGSKTQSKDIGFIAQQLLHAQEETTHAIPGLVNDDNLDHLEASYGKLIPVLVKAIQELTHEVKELKKHRG